MHLDHFVGMAPVPSRWDTADGPPRTAPTEIRHFVGDGPQCHPAWIRQTGRHGGRPLPKPGSL